MRCLPQGQYPLLEGHSLRPVNLPESVVYRMSHPRWCAFCGFGQVDSGMRPPLLCHTEQITALRLVRALSPRPPALLAGSFAALGDWQCLAMLGLEEED